LFAVCFCCPSTIINITAVDSTPTFAITLLDLRFTSFYFEVNVFTVAILTSSAWYSPLACLHTEIDITNREVFYCTKQRPALVSMFMRILYASPDVNQRRRI
jgi:hypothetical protein